MSITVLWKGTMFDIADVKIFTDSRYPGAIFYSLEETLSNIERLLKFPDFAYVTSSYKFVGFSGSAEMYPATEPAKAIEETLTYIKADYAAAIMRTFKGELAYGHSH